jgi:hypothetical protein
VPRHVGQRADSHSHPLPAPGHPQPLPCARARHVQQVPLLLDERLPICGIAQARRYGSERHLVPIAAYDRHRTELQTLRAVHRAGRDAPCLRYAVAFNILARQGRRPERGSDALGDELAGAREQADLVQGHAFVAAGTQPLGERLLFSGWGLVAEQTQGAVR